LVNPTFLDEQHISTADALQVKLFIDAWLRTTSKIRRDLHKTKGKFMGWLTNTKYT
jgi:hypothetical protein